MKVASFCLRVRAAARVCAFHQPHTQPQASQERGLHRHHEFSLVPSATQTIIKFHLSFFHEAKVNKAGLLNRGILHTSWSISRTQLCFVHTILQCFSPVSKMFGVTWPRVVLIQYAKTKKEGESLTSVIPSVKVWVWIWWGFFLFFFWYNSHPGIRGQTGEDDIASFTLY